MPAPFSPTLHLYVARQFCCSPHGWITRTRTVSHHTVTLAWFFAAYTLPRTVQVTMPRQRRHCCLRRYLRWITYVSCVLVPHPAPVTYHSIPIRYLIDLHVLFSVAIHFPSLYLVPHGPRSTGRPTHGCAPPTCPTQPCIWDSYTLPQAPPRATTPH